MFLRFCSINHKSYVFFLIQMPRFFFIFIDYVFIIFNLTFFSVFYYIILYFNFFFYSQCTIQTFLITMVFFGTSNMLSFLSLGEKKKTPLLFLDSLGNSKKCFFNRCCSSFFFCKVFSIAFLVIIFS